MTKQMISVIIPTYNRKEKLLRALDSVFCQTELDFIGEIIVVDDGSSDHTAEAVEAYKKTHDSIEIRVILQKNQGPSAARNNGMKNAKYDYIALLDSDDEWLPEKTKLQMDVFNKYPDADFVGGNGEEKDLSIFGRRISTIHKATLKELCVKSFPVTPSVIMKKSIFDKLGGFDESTRYFEDCDYFMRICASGFGYYYLPHQIVVCDRGKKMFGQEGLSANLKQIHKDSLRTLKKLRKDGSISGVFYVFLSAFYYMKHIRRTIITKIRS